MTTVDPSLHIFEHSSVVWTAHPELVPGALYVSGVDADADVDVTVQRFVEMARARLAVTAESEFPEVQAWRRTFSRMGLKPTQYRCAAEALLRRLRREDTLPRLHPLVDLCNAISVAFAVPVAALDASKITNHLVVRPAVGNETYQTFTGETEHPDPGEVIFADRDGRSHARRWTNRQSGHSAVRASTTDALIVAEAMHESAPGDIDKLMVAIADGIDAGWQATVSPHAVLTASAPRFTFLPSP
ncbi:B3/B4 domain-containing protein [Phytoactinopolyspora limicola]|uniref:B3/B4 domain-containing protein n=1 Tax=Phytoactinopolyspora limicola TaxID=2715536 RepID=UPI001A9C4E65|nr:phenylalanine--tRNA ligase beta subunit-related protein [Phytoactinopolyspora limicola]